MGLQASVHPVPLLIALLLLVAAWRDIATRTIPNAVCLIIAISGLFDRALDGPRFAAISLCAGGILFLILMLAHFRGVIGGGDVKLIAAIACGLKLTALYPFVAVTALAGGVLAVCHLLLRAWLSHARPEKPPARGALVLARVLAAERWRISRRGSLPYGVAIVCGGLAALTVQA